METDQQMDTSLPLWNLQSSGPRDKHPAHIAVSASCSTYFTCVTAFSPHNTPVR